MKKNSKCLCIVCKEINIDLIHYYKNFNIELFVVTPVSPDLIIEGVNIINDKDVLNYGNYNFDKTIRPNWYYQQLLKYAIVLKLPFEFIHIIDGDTYLEVDAVFSLKNLYYSPKKINIKYCNYNNSFGVSARKKNFIVNHMNFHKKTFEKLFYDILISFENILLHLNNNSYFSEYYLYANYVLDLNIDYSQKKIQVFRRGDLVTKNPVLHLGKEYHIIAFEQHHKTNFIKKVLIKILFFFKVNLG
jgi:hypothetical protein